MSTNQFPVNPPLANNSAPKPTRKKRSWCCLGCLIIILLIVLIIGGLMAYSYFKFRPAPSPVEQEFKDTPDYFPPSSMMRTSFAVGEGTA